MRENFLSKSKKEGESLASAAAKEIVEHHNFYNLWQYLSSFQKLLYRKPFGKGTRALIKE